MQGAEGRPGCHGNPQLRCLNLSDSLTPDRTLHSAPTGEAYIRLNKLPEAEHWYRESLRAKPDHIPAHLTYGKLLAMTVRCYNARSHRHPSVVTRFVFDKTEVLLFAQNKGTSLFLAIIFGWIYNFVLV